MADDLTKQEMIFFTTFLRKPKGITQDEIYDDMAALSKDMGWPEYLQSVPMALEQRIEESEDRNMINQCAPLTWKPVEILRKYVVHLVDKHLDEGEKAKMHKDIIPPLRQPTLPFGFKSGITP